MHEVVLPRPVETRLRSELVKGLYWISPDLSDFDFADADGSRLRFDYQGQGRLEDIVGRLTEFVDDFQRSCAIQTPGPVFENRVGNPVHGRVMDDLLERGLISKLGQGIYVWKGEAAGLHFMVDQLVRNMALKKGFEEWVTPAVIPLSELRRSGYLKSFPHHLGFVSHLPEDMQVIRDIQQRVDRGVAENVFTGGRVFEATHEAMSPTVCCSIFSALSDTGLASSSDAVKVTARQSCFRHEGRSTSGLQRLREFHMRELVVLGNAGTVRNYSQWMQQEMCSLLENLRLDGRIESATDPFFFNNSVEKRLFQTSFDLKKEMRLHADAPDGTIAAASVNIHQDHFGRSMNIRCESEPAVSCCAGFGIDRLCYALYSQHGTDMQHWDSGLRAFIKSGGVSP